MTAIFEALPTAAANGAGAGVDLVAFGAEKTIVVEGNGSSTEPFVIIEVANDDAGVNWSTLCMFSKPGQKTINVACRWMRAVTTNYRGGGAATVNVGGDDSGTLFVIPSVPAANGNGTGLDVSSLPSFKTIQVTGTYKGCINIEISNDGGTTYSLLAAFQPNRQGIQSVEAIADFLRVRRTGIATGATAGTPVVSIGAASNEAGGGSGDNPVQPPYEVETRMIYARTTGDDETGTGTLANPYESMERAVRDFQSIYGAGRRAIVDITGTGATQNTLPIDYTLPVVKMPYVAFEPVVFDPWFLFDAGVSIQAIPRLMSTLSEADATILPADLNTTNYLAVATDTTNLPMIPSGVPAGYTFNPISGQLTLHVTTPRAAWATNALRGKILAGVNSFEHSTITASTDTTISVTINVAPTGTLQIMEPDGEIVTSATSALTVSGGLRALNCDSIAFNGLKITSSTGTFSLETGGNGYTAVQMCEVQSPLIQSYSVHNNRLNRLWLYGAVRFNGAYSLQTTIIDAPTNLFQVACSSIHWRRVYVRGLAPLSIPVIFARVAYPGSAANTAAVGPANFLIGENIEVVDLVGANIDGIRCHGGKGRLSFTDVRGCGRDAIRCSDNQGFLELTGCGSTAANGTTTTPAYGIHCPSDGYYAKTNAATDTTMPTAFSGTGDTIDADTPAAGTARLTDAGASFTKSIIGRNIVISGAGTGANNGTFLVVSYISATQITYINAAAVTETSAFTYATNPVGLRGNSTANEIKVGDQLVRTWADFNSATATRPLRNEFDVYPASYAITGTGDTIDADTPDPGFARLTDAAATFTAAMVGKLLTVTGANAANNGTFLITAFISTSQISIVNSSAVTETVALTWSVSMPSTSSTGTGCKVSR